MAKTTSKPYDTTFKELLELRPRDALALAGVTDVIDVRLVDADLATIVAAADKVLRVRTAAGEFLVHFEFQSGRDPGLADRIFWYNAALCHRHRLPVQTVVVLLAPAADIRTLTGARIFALPNGRACLTFNYDVIRLWQTSAKTILNGPTGLLPLAMLCEGTVKIEAVIAQMDRRIQAEATPQEAETLWAATYFLMGLRFAAHLARDLIPKGKIMKESTTYQATLEEGRVEEAKRFLLRLAKKRLGSPNAPTLDRIQAINDAEQLEELGEKLLRVSNWDELLPSPEAAPRKTRKKKT